MKEKSNTYVIFTNSTGLWWLRLLKSGFRHCYILQSMQKGCLWLEINPFSDQVIINTYNYKEPKSIEDMLEDKDFSVACLVDVMDAPQKCAPLGFFTCVELVKRVLGIHSANIVTPYQLYKKIKSCRKKLLTNNFFYVTP